MVKNSTGLLLADCQDEVTAGQRRWSRLLMLVAREQILEQCEVRFAKRQQRRPRCKAEEVEKGAGASRGRAEMGEGSGGDDLWPSRKMTDALGSG